MEYQIQEVKKKLIKCRALLKYGNASVWDRISSYSTSLITVTSNTNTFNNNKILKAIEQEELNTNLIDNYMNIVNQLNQDAKKIINLAYMTNHYTVEEIAYSVHMSVRNVQRILADTLRIIAYLDTEIDYTINDLYNYYQSKKKKRCLVIKKTVEYLIKDNYRLINDLLINETIKIEDLQEYYSKSIENKYKKRKVLRSIYLIALTFQIIDEDEYIDLMKHTQERMTNIEKKIKKSRLFQRNFNNQIKKNIKA